MADDSFRDRLEARRARSRARRRGARPAKKRPRAPSIARIDPDSDETDAHRDYDNPFAPPAEERPRKRRRRNQHHVDASLGQRFANLLVDNITAYVLIVVFALPIAMTFPGALDGPLGWLVALSGSLGYYTVTEGMWGRTLGKLVTGTRVVSEDGTPVTLGQAFYRSLARMIPFEAFSFLGGTGRGWHDRLPRTRVVRITS